MTQTIMVSAQFSTSTINNVIGSDTALVRLFVAGALSPEDVGPAGPDAERLTALEERIGLIADAPREYVAPARRLRLALDDVRGLRQTRFRSSLHDRLRDARGHGGWNELEDNGERSRLLQSLKHHGLEATMDEQRVTRRSH